MCRNHHFLLDIWKGFFYREFSQNEIPGIYELIDILTSDILK